MEKVLLQTLVLQIFRKMPKKMTISTAGLYAWVRAAHSELVFTTENLNNVITTLWSTKKIVKDNTYPNTPMVFWKLAEEKGD